MNLRFFISRCLNIRNWKVSKYKKEYACKEHSLAPQSQKNCLMGTTWLKKFNDPFCSSFLFEECQIWKLYIRKAGTLRVPKLNVWKISSIDVGLSTCILLCNHGHWDNGQDCWDSIWIDPPYMDDIHRDSSSDIIRLLIKIGSSKS